jgi:hypothetical protein
MLSERSILCTPLCVLKAYRKLYDTLDVRVNGESESVLLLMPESMVDLPPILISLVKL